MRFREGEARDWRLLMAGFIVVVGNTEQYQSQATFHTSETCANPCHRDKGCDIICSAVPKSAVLRIPRVIISTDCARKAFS